MLRVPAAALRERSDAWFPFGGHLYPGLYHTARSIESTARQRESLVTLGTLAAGLAHELNNPASAATRSVDALQTACDALVAAMGRLAGEDFPAARLAALDGLRARALAAGPGPAGPRRPRAGPGVVADPPGRRARLDDRPAARCRGWTRRGARAAAVLEGPALQPGLEWVASTFSVAALLEEEGPDLAQPEPVAAVRLTAAGPRLAAAGRRDRRARQHPGCWGTGCATA